MLCCRAAPLAAGNPALAVDSSGSPLTTDQRGVGFPRIVNGAVDIGAYETSGGAPPVQHTPAISWASPADITYGTAISATQLDATASYNGVPVSGTFTYGCPIGTILHAGQAQTLDATFTPDDRVDYATVYAATTINIDPVPLTITAHDATMVYGTSLPQFTASYAGFVNQDTAASLATPPILATLATATSPVGSYLVTVSGAVDPDYVISYQAGTLSVTPQAAPSLTVTAPGGTYNGTAYVATPSFTAIEGTPVTLDYQQGTTDLGSTAPINAGTYMVTANFAGSTDYSPTSSTPVSFTIAKADAPVSVTGYSVVYSGTAHTATGVGNLGADLNLRGTTHVNAGVYTDSWSFTDPAGNYNPASGTVVDTIAKANARITVTPYTIGYNATAHAASGVALGVNGAPLAGLNLAGTVHVTVGSYTDQWSFTDPTGNYNNASGTMQDTVTATKSKLVKETVLVPTTVQVKQVTLVPKLTMVRVVERVNVHGRWVNETIRVPRTVMTKVVKLVKEIRMVKKVVPVRIYY